jgi:lipopolysaccharide/colanic/teichoic acid biosynthesis glycosyltransferase
VGRFGEPFVIHKFRTMRVEPGAAITVGDDPRITRSGRLLRQAKLDELPQLWDVLRGAMSLVGPRPELLRYVELYPEPLKRAVLTVRPGITDPASLAYSHEAELLAVAADPEREYREVILPAKLRLSADYAAHASLASDLKLIARTLSRVLRG